MKPKMFMDYYSAAKYEDCQLQMAKIWHTFGL